MHFPVTDRKCDECLFSPDKIVSDERRRQVLDETAAANSFFVCHKASLAGRRVCCRGYYDAHLARGVDDINRLLGHEVITVDVHRVADLSRAARRKGRA